MIPEWGQTVFNGAALDATTNETAELWGVGPDYGSYFQGAFSWYQEGVLANPSYHWITNLWPPGMVFLNLVAMSIAGLDGPFILTLVCITTLTWALVFTCGFFSCKTSIHRVVFVTGILIILLTTPFSYWVASDYFALPTGFALAFSLLALMALGSLKPTVSLTKVKPNIREFVVLMAIAGPLLAISLIFRIASLFAIYGAIATALVLGAWGIILRIRNYDRAELSHKISKRLFLNNRFAVQLLVISFLPILTMLSWTWIVTAKAHPMNFAYTVTVPELANAAPWRPDEQLIESGNSWLLDSSSNWACRIDKKTCAKIAQAESISPRPWAGVGEYSARDYTRLAVFAAIKNPLGYIKERAPKAWRNWSSGNVAQGLLFSLTTTVAIAVAMLQTLRKREIQAFIFVCTIFFATAPMLTILFYFYYFIPIQIGSIFYLLINQNATMTLLSQLRRTAGMKIDRKNTTK